MTKPPPVTNSGWLAALDIVIHKPHSVDKRLAGQMEVEVWEGELREIINGEWILDEEAERNIKQLVKEGRDEGVLQEILGVCAKDGGVSVVVRLQKLVGRSERFNNCYQLVVIMGNRVEFVPLDVENSDKYRLELLEGEMKPRQEEETREDVEKLFVGDDMRVVTTLAKGCSKLQRVWLRERLVLRLVGWARDKMVGMTNRVDSLRLVGLELYGKEYQKLKDIYAKDIISNWAESSDPEKFVHEDLGIAAYILLLWRQQRIKESWEEGRKQTFVDLGCGNGLLVYLLTMEGHKGVGYDIRRRNIWSWFPNNVELREEAIRPSLSTSFPGTDWVLGNHSDELTPWVPVMAALSSPTTSYWVLPCCPFSFSSKYQRKDANKSVWRDYLDWLGVMGREAGFQVEEDRMRIPSTKRVCLVGMQMVGAKDRQSELDKLVSRYAVSFVPREKVERVRNCSQVDKVVVGDIVDRVVALCLKEENMVEMEMGNWNCGGSIQLGCVVRSLVEQEVDLTRLKDECGGLQTLLRNHHYIFLVEKGLVRLRVPGKDQPRNRRGKSHSVNSTRHKTKPCWHHHHHPQGCPLQQLICHWSH